MGHTEELAKQNTFNNLDPYNDDDAVFLHTDDTKDHLLRKALDTMAIQVHTRGVVKEISTGKVFA